MRYRPMTGLMMAERRSVTKTIATRYKRADKAAKAESTPSGVRSADVKWLTHHCRIVSYVSITPRTSMSSSTSRKLSGNR